MGLLQGGQGRSQGVVLRPAAVQLLDGLPPGLKGSRSPRVFSSPWAMACAAAQPGELSLRRAQAGRGLGRAAGLHVRPAGDLLGRGAGCRPGFWPPPALPWRVDRRSRPGSAPGRGRRIRRRCPVTVGGEGVHQLRSLRRVSSRAMCPAKASPPPPAFLAASAATTHASR